MAVLEVLCFPDERLRTIAQPVNNIDDNLRTIIENMFETMYLEEGVGLAATQVNIHQQIVVIDVSEERDQRLALINPEIIEADGDALNEEGCLSVPEYRAQVPRAEKIKVKSLDVDGNEQIFEAEGLLAICVQHELDHLKGKLFIDYLSPLKRQRVKTKLEKLARRK
ncbi:MULTISPECIES: peptide deformylase [unclassified Agarivorans]|uniref:peptide deformylase n=1 Tax=unclassified Agarivorans TaxID=2636026 RepID=UPI0010E75F7B|nr:MULTISPECIES: peptide deformylase [unclassified Agarivorans]MDO6685466.1 peptide deformylase [Agarivorans sp. 3_MG-2023]MDO6715852.1 peptide deformylase [Agarivorans sp. 2_MG-2023]MDO6764894.1 peptide deformylase [Agarivorans sp. 1_MG-2023]GDY25273.1 peptide deformylase [Agarivorans sp. Toyoura001]